MPLRTFPQCSPFAETFVLLTFEVSCGDLGTSQQCASELGFAHHSHSIEPTLGSASSIVSWQEEDEFIVEGLLNISWGLRRPIRLQMQDDHERIRPPPSSSSWHSGCNLGAQG